MGVVTVPELERENDAVEERVPSHFFDEPELDQIYKLNNNQKFHLNRIFIAVYKKQILSFLVATVIAAIFLMSSLSWSGMIQALGILIMGSYLNYYYSKDKVFKGYIKGEVEMLYASSFSRDITISINLIILGILLSLGFDLISMGWLGISLASAIWLFGIWRFVSLFFKVNTVEANIQVIAPWV